MRKKITLLSVMALLCLNFWASAQEPTLKIESLKVGDKLPESFWEQEHTIYQKGKTSTQTLAQYKGKLLILDFWATWCIPCVGMIPVMDSLERKFKNDVHFVSISKENEQTVKRFLQERIKFKGIPEHFTSIVSDKALNLQFPHLYLPHYVWVDRVGTIRAVTDLKEINEENLNYFIKSKLGELLDIQNAQYAPAVYYDKFQPMVGRNSGDTTKIIMHSYLTAYQEGMGMGSGLVRFGNMGRISIRNYSVTELFRMAYKENGTDIPASKMIINVADTSMSRHYDWFGQQLRNYLKAGNGFCYELIFPWSKVGQAHEWMREDLKRYFPQFRAELISKDFEILTLIRISKDSLFLSKNGKYFMKNTPFNFEVKGLPLNTYLSRLRTLYLDGLEMELVNETGFVGKVDINISGEITSLKVVNEQLAPYGLKLAGSIRSRPTLLISDVPEVQLSH